MHALTALLQWRSVGRQCRRARGEVLGPTHRYTTALVGAGTTAVMATVGNLGAPASHWTAGGTPLTAMMCIERCALTLPSPPCVGRTPCGPRERCCMRQDGGCILQSLISGH